jgi:tetratricopeptide (TPR) repeat protein/predicted acylesterase/phospholipase RssA
LSNLCDQDAKTQHALPNFVIDPPENLVFKGNDSTGVAYLGVIKALEVKGKIDGIKRVAGPSTGALIATLFALGYPFDEIASKAKILSDFFDCPLADQPISAIPKDSPEYATVATLRDIIQKHSLSGKDQFKTLHQLPSLCSGEALLNWLKECIDEKTGISDCTFGELKELVKTNPRFKHLTIFTACFGCTLIPSKFSSEDMASDEIVIAHAVCAALSVPGIYPLKTLYSKNKAGGVDPSPSLGLHGDATMINNFPIEVYDLEKYQSKVPLDAEAREYFRLNKRTLGFAFAPTPFKSTLTDACTVHELLLETLAIYCQCDPPVQQMTSYNKFRIIQIENRVGGLFNSVHEEQKDAVIIAGVSTTVDFFEKQERLATSESSFRFYHLRTNQGSRWNNLKPPLPYFVGRTSQIGFLKQRLIDETAATSSCSSSSSSSSSTFSIKQRSPCVVLTGAEGMGKSETAIEFAHIYRDKFSVIWWIEMATPESIERSFRELAEALNLSIDQTCSFKYIRREVYHFLEFEPLENPYLLIFDNAEQAIELPQDGKGRFIITTTESGHFSEKDLLPMDVFNPEEAMALLQTILEQEINGEMRELANEVECLPVILSQAAQHIRSTRMTLNAYLELLAEEKLKVISMMLPDARYSKTQISAWRITHKRLEEREPMAYEWLEVCAHLQPDAIPFSYLDMWLKLFKNHLTDVERVLMKSFVLKTLDHLGILRLDHQKETYSLHRIRQEMIQASHEPAKTHLLRRQVMHLLSAIGRSLNLEENGEWLTFAPHECHFRFILETVDVESVVEEVAQSIEDMRSTNIALTHNFWNSTPESLHPRVNMDTIDDKVDRDYEDEACMRNLLGRWCLIQGKLTEAETSLMRSLKIWRNNVSGDHIDLANTLHYIGNFFLTQNRPQKGELYYLESYNMRRRLYGGDHREIAASLHNLGRCCPLTDFERAESYFNEALEMLRRIYPEEHYLIALVFANKGVYYGSANRLDDAYVSTLESWHILERLYPESNGGNCPFVGDQPIMAFVLGRLGQIIRRQGNEAEAVNYLKRAVVIQKSIGQHCMDPLVLEDLGAAFLNMGDYHEARSYCLASIERYRKLESTSFFLGALLHNLGVIEYKLNQMTQAKSYFIESLECYKTSIDRLIHHQDNIRILKQTFRILSEIDNTQTKESAINYFRDLGNSLEAIGKNAEAALFFAEADRIASSWTCAIL